MEADEKIKALQNKKPVQNIVPPVGENKMEELVKEEIQTVITPNNGKITYENNSDPNQKNPLSSKLILFGIPIFIVAMFAISKFVEMSPSAEISNNGIEPLEKEDDVVTAPDDKIDEIKLDDISERVLEKTIPEKDDAKNQIAINQPKEEINNRPKTNTSKPATNNSTNKPATEIIKKDEPVVPKAPVEKPSVTRRKAVVKKLEQNMVYLGGGSFAMGSPSLPDAPIHEVKITRGFSISKTEVTQELWKAVMRSNPSFNKNCGPQCPVENVSYYEVQEFLKKLNDFTGKNYRLPTEAEWEYASIAGQSNDLKYQNPSNLSALAYYNGNTQSSKPVSQKSPNKRGMTDMLGNVAEWCEDWYAEDFYKDGATNPRNKNKGLAASKVIRGGSFMSRENKCSIFYRDAMSPNARKKYIGFRVVSN